MTPPAKKTDFTNHALDLLKGQGLRITKPRKLILNVLALAEKPLSAYEIQSIVTKNGDDVDVTSVYRFLETLEQVGFVHQALAQGKYMRCQLECQEHHCDDHDHDGHTHDHKDIHGKQHAYHVLHCRACGLLQEISCPGLENINQLLSQQQNFKAETHHLQVTGICANCQ
jgi:Fe2+ or Zn2+ uptake regulation protein